MKFGINPSHELELIGGWAETAERMGFDTITVGDSNGLWPDPYVGLTICALRTSKIELGVGVTNPFTRHPAVTANAILSVNMISGGRAFLGIGTGDNVANSLGRSPASVQQIEVAINYMRKIQSGELAKLENEKALNIRWTKQTVPILLAASNPRILRLAGRIADGAITIAASEPIVRFAISEIEKGSKTADRGFRRPSLTVYCAIAIGSNRNDLVRKVRSSVATYVHLSSKSLERASGHLPEGFREDLARIVNGYNVSQHGLPEASHGHLVKEWMIDTFSVIGRPEECIEKLAQLQKAGVDRIVTPVRSDVKGFIETFGKEVIPHFK